MTRGFRDSGPGSNRRRTAEATSFRPALEPLEDRVVLSASASALTVGGDPVVDPNEFCVTVFASDVNFPFSMVELSDGSILFGSSDPVGNSFFDSVGQLIRLVDNDGDGVADGPGTVLASGLPGVVTSVRQAGDLFFVLSGAGINRSMSVLRAGATPDSPFGFVGSIDFAFPDGWEHTSFALATRTVGSGVHEVFFNVGSEENFGPSPGTIPISGLLTGDLTPESIYRFTVDDSGQTPVFSSLELIAIGLRNAAGIAFHPETGDLYFEDNGIDGLSGNRGEPESADELNVLAAQDIGGAVEDYGYFEDYIQYRTGTRIQIGGANAIQPLIAFQPIPNPFTGFESEGPVEIAFAPPGFPNGLNNGWFIGFHGQGSGGVANEENPVVFADQATNRYFHFISTLEPNVGHPNSVLATNDALYIADLSSTGSLSGTGTGVIYKIQAVGPPPNEILMVDVSESMAAPLNQDINSDGVINGLDDANGDGINGSPLDMAIQTVIDRFNAGEFVGTVAVGTFGREATALDLSNAPGTQLFIDPAADSDRNGVADLVDTVRSLRFGGGGHFSEAFVDASRTFYCPALDVVNELAALVPDSSATLFSDGGGATGCAIASPIPISTVLVGPYGGVAPVSEFTSISALTGAGNSTIDNSIALTDIGFDPSVAPTVIPPVGRSSPVTVNPALAFDQAFSVSDSLIFGYTPQVSADDVDSRRHQAAASNGTDEEIDDFFEESEEVL